MPRSKLERVVELIDVDELMRAFAQRIADGYLYGDCQFSTDTSSDTYLRETGGFSRPTGAAVDAASNFYVAYSGHDRIQAFSASGSLLRTWTSFCASDGFSAPSDVALSPTGELYVSDTGHGRIVEFDAGGSFVRSWPVPGSVPSAPTGIDVDGAGDLYVADPANAHVEKYDASGHLLVAWGRRGHALGEFWTGGPSDVTTDAAGNVYVSDTYDNRVERFTLPAAAAPPPSDSGAGSSPSGTSGAAASAAAVTEPAIAAAPVGVPAPASSNGLGVARTLLRQALATEVASRLRVDRHGRVRIRVTPCRAPSVDANRAAII